MQPLPLRTRLTFLFLLALVFATLLPLVILYANGWRFSPTLGVYKTGGIFISVPYQDATISINGTRMGRSGFFDRSLYIGELAPDTYVIQVDRDGYLPWSRTLVIEPELVTDVSVLLFPKRVELERLAVSGVATTGVAVIPRTQYNTYITAFTATTTASTTVAQDEVDGVGLFIKNGDVYARWISEDTFPPAYFCGQPSSCVHEIVIEQGGETATSARFFRGGVIYVTHEGGIYFSEMDVRPSPISVKLFQADDAQARVVGNTLIIWTGGALYRVNLL